MSLRSDDLDSVVELYTHDDLGQLVVTAQTIPTFLGGLCELEDHGKRGLVREASLRSGRSMADGGERALDRVGRAQVLPVLGGEVVEGEQHVAILGQALDRLVVLRAVDFRESIERGLGVLPGLGHPDVLKRPLGFGLQALRQPVEDIGGLVHPAALLARLRPDLGERLPEAERAVGDGELRPDRKSASLEIEQEFLPRLRALAHAVGQADQFLLALRRRADDHEQALRIILKPGLDVDAVDPEVDVAFGGQVAT